MSKINWFEPKIDNYSKETLNKTIKSNFISEGKVTLNLERKLGAFLKINNVVMTSSGTSALYLALRSLNIKQGDEVIVPNITYVATINSVKLTGAKPIIVDVDKKTSTIDFEDLKKKINKKTKVIIFVHISGRPGNFKKILCCNQSCGKSAYRCFCHFFFTNGLFFKIRKIKLCIYIKVSNKIPHNKIF